MTKKSKRGFRIYQGNVLLVSFFRLLVVLLLFFFSRIIFYLFNLHYFSGLRVAELFNLFFLGLRFDISAILIINLPFIFFTAIPFRFRYNKYFLGFTSTYFYLINCIGLMANFIDLIYFRFTLKRTTADIFSYLGVGGDFGKLIPQFMTDFWYVMATWIIFCFLLVYLATRFLVAIQKGKSQGKGGSYLLIHTLIFIFVASVTVTGIRGGLQRRPITIITAGNYTNAKYVPLVLNTPFSIAKTWGHEVLATKKYFQKETDLEKIYSPVHHYSEGGFKNFNVMIIIMESFSLEHIGTFNGSLDNGQYKGFTPFLDTLITQSMVYRAFANGKSSIQGIPAILSGIPSLMNESYIQSNYSANKVASLASLLKSEGYSTAFFHGGSNGTMGFDSYSKFTGFDHYYGRKEYHNEQDYDGKWGIRDEEFFQYTAKMTNQLSQPFMVSLFSLSSHHPYFVPQIYAGKFRKGKLPIQESIMYADYSLKKFFETIKKMPWFENTLFVITADHTSEGYYPYYQTNTGQYAIPIIFYKHNSMVKGNIEGIAQQTDIMPSVLAYLGYNKPFLAFGNDIFDKTSLRFSIHYISGTYGLIKDGYLLEFNGDKTTALYDLSSDPLQKSNLLKNHPQVKDSLEIFIKAYIQQYNNRIIENRLTTD
jgi:phosphoglycerol transferase MdoB-like AlkP superfamily enzyme